MNPLCSVEVRAHAVPLFRQGAIPSASGSAGGAAPLRTGEGPQRAGAHSAGSRSARCSARDVGRVARRDRLREHSPRLPPAAAAPRTSSPLALHPSKRRLDLSFFFPSSLFSFVSYLLNFENPVFGFGLFTFAI